MMSFKFVYFIKLLLIVTLSAVLLASTGALPDQPLLFLAVAAVCTVLIRSLWKSALKDEEKMNRQKIPFRKTSAPLPSDLKRAA